MSPNVVAALVSVFVGWMLGLVSAPLTEWLAHRRLARRLAGPLDAELRDLRDRAAGTFWILQKNLGAMTRPDLQWVADHLRPAGLDRSQHQVERLHRMLELSDDQLKVLFGQPEERGLSLRKLEVPFLASHLERLHVYGPLTQQLLLQLSTDLHLYNELVDDAQKYFDMTFASGLKADNHRLVTENLRQVEGRGAKAVKEIADRAASALRSLAAEVD